MPYLSFSITVNWWVVSQNVVLHMLCASVISILKHSYQRGAVPTFTTSNYSDDSQTRCAQANLQSRFHKDSKLAPPVWQSPNSGSLALASPARLELGLILQTLATLITFCKRAWTQIRISAIPSLQFAPIYYTQSASDFFSSISNTSHHLAAHFRSILLAICQANQASQVGNN